MRTTSRRAPRSLIAAFVAAFLLFSAVGVAVASDLDVAAIDADGSVSAVTLAAGQQKTFTINLAVTGRQEHPASFKIYRDWTLQSDGSFVGSNEATFNVPARAAGAAAWTDSAAAKVVVPGGQVDRGPDDLTIEAHDIVTQSPAALSMGAAATIAVTVENPAGDTTPPVITITTPPDGAVYTLGQSVLATYSCLDAQSAVTTCDGTVADGAAIDTTTVGSTSFRVDATSAGGASHLTHTYTVIYDFGGFERPIDAQNRAKAGQAIPVKFSLGGDQGMSIFAAGFPKVVACDMPASEVFGEDPVETVTANKSGLQYDTATGLYNYVWKTDKAQAGSCMRLVLRFNDGRSYSADFALTR